MILTVVFGVLLVVVAADDDCARPAPFRAAARINERITALEEGAAAAKDKLSTAFTRGRAIGAKVMRMERRGMCPNGRDFQCGGFERRCISDLLVCDGQEDCADGQDERDFLCRSRAPVGSVFVAKIGRRNQGGCGADIREVRVSIIGTQRPAWFQSRERVKAAVSLTRADGSEIGGVVKGYYSFRQMALILLPLENVPVKLGFTCEFDGVQDDRCLGSARFANLEPCVQFGMRKE